MDDIADQLRKFAAVLARAYYGDKFTKHLQELRYETNTVVLVVDADPGDRFGDLDVRIEITAGEMNRETAFDESWDEVVYDLFAYTEPLSNMGRQLSYQRISRAGDAVSVIITDGRHTRSYSIDLADLTVGYPDDFATDFLTAFPPDADQ